MLKSALTRVLARDDNIEVMMMARVLPVGETELWCGWGDEEVEVIDLRCVRGKSRSTALT